MKTVHFEQSLKAKLRVIAKEKNCDPADLWQHLMVERFLVRLARSDYHDRFVLKGATLLSKYVDIGRETKDIDMLACRMSNDVEDIKTVFESVAKIDLKDGFVFRDVEAQVLFHPHMSYHGTKASMIVYFGKTKFKVEVDVGFGDIVEPVMYSLPLTTYSKGPLFEDSVHLLCYPKEFIFAEKLETIVYRGELNSRMKDFHDVYSLIQFFTNDPCSKIEETIQSVFAHRGTPLSVPIIYVNDNLEVFWKRYINALQHKERNKLPKSIKEVVKVINDWLGQYEF